MKIAAYCRVSTEKEEQLDSLYHQKLFFSEYADKNGHELVQLYADEGISGTSLKRREAFQRLMQDAEMGLFEMVVVKDISRFARNTVDFLQSIRTLKSYGINTLFLTANMESLGESEFVLTVFGAMAQEESANLSKRVKFGKKINAKKGRVPQCVFGYDRMDNFTLEINPQEANVVREIYRLYLEGGLGCRTISSELNRLGYRTKLNCQWNPRAVRRVLTNSIYCGRYVNNKYEIQDYLTGKQVPLPAEKQFHHDRPQWAIVSDETFDRAQRQLEERRKKYDAGGPFRGGRYSSKHLFSTLIRCEHCGRSFCRKSYTYINTRNYWKCTTNDQFTAEACDNGIKLEEAALLEELRTYFSSLIVDRRAFIGDVLKQLETQLPDIRRPNGSKEHMEKQREKLLAKRERYQEMYANDMITLAELKEKIDGILERLKRVDLDFACAKQTDAIKDRAHDMILQSKYTEQIIRFLNLETATNMDLRRLVDRISVNKSGQVRILLKDLRDGKAQQAHLPI